MTETTPPTLPANDLTRTDTTIESRPVEKKKTGALREIIETALLAVLIFVTVRAVVLNFKVDGTSMLPTLENSEMILVNRNAYRELDLGDLVDWLPGVSEQEWFTVVDWGEPTRGEVVVFTPPEPGDQKPYIKRVVGMPGDHIQVTGNEVLVNGIPLDEPYIGSYRNDCESVSNFPHCDVTVPEGHYFVMGDHRSNSQDSRYFGVVPENRIIGKAWLVYWPSEEFGTVDHPGYPELTP
jgi:signal peptidase I